MLRFLTAGESHGRALVVIVDGLPAGLALDVDADARPAPRRAATAAGAAWPSNPTRADILSGVRRGRTTGAPVAVPSRTRTG